MVACGKRRIARPSGVLFHQASVIRVSPTFQKTTHRLDQVVAISQGLLGGFSHREKQVSIKEGRHGNCFLRMQPSLPPVTGWIETQLGEPATSGPMIAILQSFKISVHL